MTSTVPLRALSLFNPLAFLMMAAVVPNFRAMLERLSEDFTTYFLLLDDLDLVGLLSVDVFFDFVVDDLDLAAPIFLTDGNDLRLAWDLAHCSSSELVAVAERPARRSPSAAQSLT